MENRLGVEAHALELINLLERGGRMGIFDYCFIEDRGYWSRGQADLYGVPQPADGMPWAEWVKMLVAEDYDRFLAGYNAAIRERRSEFDFSFRVRRPDGNRWIGGFVKIEYDASGRPLRLSGVNKDISDRKLAEQRAIDAQRQKVQVMSAISADLDSPLTAIRQALDVARKQAPLPDGLPWVLESIEAQAALLSRLAEDLREAAKGAARSARKDIALFSVDRLVDMALQTAMPSVRARDQEFSVCASSEVLIIEGDAVRLAQSISNVLKCIAGCSPREGFLRLNVYTDAGRAMLSVQAHGGTCTDSRCGVALELARTVLAHHGGSIEFRQTEDGLEGDPVAEAIVVLPLAKPPAQRTATAAELSEALS
jgi:signal transduction histidine kinase